MYSLFAWRYFKAKKSTNIINIIAWICIVAIAIGTAALLLVLSVFNGFEGLVKSLYSAFYTDLKVTAQQGKVITLTPAQLQKLRGIKGIKNFSLVVEEKAILQDEETQSLVYLKGVDSNYRTTTGVAGHLINGKFDIGTEKKPLLVLGSGVEAALGIRANNNPFPLTIYIPRKTGSEDFDLASGISPDTIHTAAAFMIQQDFDNKYAITNIDFLKYHMDMTQNQFNGIEIAVANADKTNDIKKQVQQLLGTAYTVQDRYEQNQSLYSVMSMERWVFYGILCLILVVAAFNMIGALTMLVLEKQKDISILNALGANQNFILKIFLSEGFLLALLGGGIGMALAVIMIVLQQQYHLVPLQGGSFLINYFPVQMRLADFLLVAATIVIIAFLASFLPAYKASKQQFSLRSE